jgi:hypothetical protein
MPDQTDNQPELNESSGTVDDTGYKATIQKVRRERDEQAAAVKTLKKQLEEFQKQFEGIDPAKFAEYKQQVQNAEEERQKTVEEQAKLISSERDRSAQLAEELMKAKAALETEQRMAQIRQAFFDAGGRRSSGTASFLDIVMPYALERIARDENGQLVVIQKGSKFIDLDPSTVKTKTIENLMTEFTKDPVLGTAFEPRSQASGGGFVAGAKPGQTSLSVAELMRLSPGEMARIGRELKK